MSRPFAPPLTVVENTERISCFFLPFLVKWQFSTFYYRYLWFYQDMISKPKSCLQKTSFCFKILYFLLICLRFARFSLASRKLVVSAFSSAHCLLGNVVAMATDRRWRSGIAVRSADDVTAVVMATETTKSNVLEPWRFTNDFVIFFWRSDSVRSRLFTWHNYACV